MRINVSALVEHLTCSLHSLRLNDLPVRGPTTGHSPSPTMRQNRNAIMYVQEPRGATRTIGYILSHPPTTTAEIPTISATRTIRYILSHRFGVAINQRDLSLKLFPQFWFHDGRVKPGCNDKTTNAATTTEVTTTTGRSNNHNQISRREKGRFNRLCECCELTVCSSY